MPLRGLIVAIESYAQMQEGLAPTLDGTHAGALAFRKWLVEERGVAPEHIRFCAEDEGLEGRTSGATLDEIVDEISALVNEGRDKTEALFVYLAGHGFSYTDIDGVRVADVLLAADYSDRQHGWRTCLSIDEIVKWLRLSLGPLDHFYFVDCCRNGISAAEIKVAQIGPYGASDLGWPDVYMLYSTTPGQLAAVQSGFTRVLVDGLNGNGRAKDLHNGQWAVLYRTLKPYLVKAVPGQAVDGREEGNHDGLIRVIEPPPRYTCNVVVDDAGADEEFRLELATVRGQPLPSRTFKGPSYPLSEPPDDYRLALFADGVALTPLDPLPLDLFSDSTFRFTKPRARRRGAAVPEAAPAPPPPTQVRAPEAARIVVRRAGEPETEATTGSGEFDVELAPGTYDVEVLDARNLTVRHDELHVGAQPPAAIDLARFERSPLRDALLQAIPGHHQAGAVDFSETLGLMPDQGLDMWLGLIGAARILQSPMDDFSKLGPLPLASFDQTPAGACPLYLLAGLEDDAPVRAAVDGPLEDSPSHSTIPGLHELVVEDLGAGVHLLGVAVGRGEPLVLPVAGLPNRATLVTAWRDDRGALRFGHFVLPIPHLEEHLPPYGNRLTYDAPLPVVRRLVELQRRFAAARALEDVHRDDLSFLLGGKWFEPVSTLLAAYELARRGAGERLREAVGNLRLFFGEFPDTEAIARRAGLSWSMPDQPPLVLDGLLALDRLPNLLPLPPEDLLYDGPWTLWRGEPVND
jgi:hypothetical protein